MRVSIFCSLAMVGLLHTTTCSVVRAESASTQESTSLQLPFDLYKFEGSQQIAQKIQKFGELEFHSTIKPRGQTLQLAYRIASGNAPLEVIENYRQSLGTQGFSVVREAKESYRAEAAKDGQVVVLKRPEGAGESVVRVESYTVRNNWKAGALRNFFGTDAKVDPDEVLTLVEIVTPKTVEQRMVKEEVSYILKQLSISGRVSLYGIYFDVDKTALKPESNQVLDEVSKALQQEPELNLQVIGHTDNTGSKEHNLSLSQGRASAVVAALVSRGVSAKRLSAEGRGDSQPVASNDAEDGRAKNRRVELVKVS